MVFVDIAYAVTMPLCLLALLCSTGVIRRNLQAVMAVSNLLLLFHSFFLVRQLIGIVQLMRSLGQQFGISPRTMPMQADVTLVRLLLLILYPLIFLHPKCRSNMLFSLPALGLIYWNNNPNWWNTNDVLFKTLQYLCLLCAAYALLWLLKKLPFQLSAADNRDKRTVS